MPQPSRRGPPRMLQNVVKAIADLKNTEGCTMRNIISRINTLEEKRPHSRRPKDISLQVRKALKQGTDAGVIIHSARKYKLATTPSKCSNLLARSHASRRRKPRRRRSKSRRRRKSSTVSVSEASDLPSDLSTTTGGEVTESGRKRRKRSRSKRRRRRHRQQSFDEGSDEENERGAGKRPRRNRSNSNNEGVCDGSFLSIITSNKLECFTFLF